MKKRWNDSQEDPDFMFGNDNKVASGLKRDSRSDYYVLLSLCFPQVSQIRNKASVIFIGRFPFWVRDTVLVFEWFEGDFSDQMEFISKRK